MKEAPRRLRHLGQVWGSERVMRVMGCKWSGSAMMAGKKAGMGPHTCDSSSGEDDQMLRSWGQSGLTDQTSASDSRMWLE